MFARKRRTVFIGIGGVILLGLYFSFKSIAKSESDFERESSKFSRYASTKEKTYSIENSRKLQQLREKVSRTDWTATPAIKPVSNDLHDRWIVLTTINKPTEDIKHLAAIDDWKLVVVADTKTPLDWSFPNVVFLDIEMQKTLGYKTLAYVPYKNYARKNIGYLYAIQHGAKIIYETDDDNHPTSGQLEFHEADTGQFLMYDTDLSIVNPYSYFGQSSIWPRGYPLDKISEPLSLQRKFIYCDGVKPMIQQGVVDGDPDVDAIFRLTRKDSDVRVDVKFDPQAPPVALPPKTMAPFNSQNTVFLYDALWALPLGTTITMRVTDIWRGYWAQRLLWEIGGYLTFFAPNAVQYRSPHNFLDDFIEENQLYHKAGDFISFLLNWKSNNAHFFSRVMDLSISMAEEGFWGVEDAEMIYAWLSDLINLGYIPPEVNALNQACQSVLPGGGVIIPREQPSSYLRIGHNVEEIISAYNKNKK